MRETGSVSGTKKLSPRRQCRVSWLLPWRPSAPNPCLWNSETISQSSQNSGQASKKSLFNSGLALLLGCLLLSGCWESSTSDKPDAQSKPRELGPPPEGQSEPDFDEPTSAADPAPQSPALGEPAPFGNGELPPQPN